MEDAESDQSGQLIERAPKPLTLARLAKLNEYDGVVQTLRLLIANGELADYDDELANRVHDAIEIVSGVCYLAQQFKMVLALDGENDVIDNLEGAIQNLRHEGAGRVCIDTIERVQTQIVVASKLVV